jgi:hypothetical protein
MLDDDQDLASPLLRRGALVRGNGQRFFLTDATLVVDLMNADSWSPILRPIAPLNDSVLRRNVDEAIEIATRHVSTDGFGPLYYLLTCPNCLAEQVLPSLAAKALPIVRRATLAVDDLDWEQAVAAARGLIGLGVGLTPSGDDFIVGLSAALVAIAHPVAGTFARGCAREADGRTTDVAWSYLDHASRAEFSSRIHRLLKVLATGSRSDVRAEVAGVMCWGATSGADCLLGVLVGLAHRTEANFPFSPHGRKGRGDRGGVP